MRDAYSGDKERVEKSHRKGQKGISWERMYRDYGISQNRPLWFDVHKDKITRLEGIPKKKVLKIWVNYVTELYDRPNRPETLEVEPEEEVDTDEKGPYILKSEVE